MEISSDVNDRRRAGFDLPTALEDRLDTAPLFPPAGDAFSSGGTNDSFPREANVSFHVADAVATRRT